MTSQPSASEAILSETDLERFCEYLYRRTGMTFGENKRYYIDRRVAERMATTQASSFADWFARLRNDPAELESVVNAFTVNETYFWREAHQFSSLSRAILPEIVRAKGPGDKVRLWSLPCSTGEEPYSLAIWLLENWSQVDVYNVEIVGSDIDTEALAEARRGVYGERALSRMPPELAEHYFEVPRAGTGGAPVRPVIRDLRESVTYTEANLVDRASMTGQGEFEVIFCRNVLIYFDAAARRTAAENLFTALRPGGFLLLGHTESMSRIDDRFITRRFDEAVVYQRPPA